MRDVLFSNSLWAAIDVQIQRTRAAGRSGPLQLSEAVPGDLPRASDKSPDLHCEFLCPRRRRELGPCASTVKPQLEAVLNHGPTARRQDGEAAQVVGGRGIDHLERVRGAKRSRLWLWPWRSHGITAAAADAVGPPARSGGIELGRWPICFASFNAPRLRGEGAGGSSRVEGRDGAACRGCGPPCARRRAPAACVPCLRGG